MTHPLTYREGWRGTQPPATPTSLDPEPYQEPEVNAFVRCTIHMLERSPVCALAQLYHLAFPEKSNAQIGEWLARVGNRVGTHFSKQRVAQLLKQADVTFTAEMEMNRDASRNDIVGSSVAKG